MGLPRYAAPCPNAKRARSAVSLHVITPYRRLCGTVLLVVAAVLGPNLQFATAIATSPRVGGLARWVLVGISAAFLMLPALRRISERASWLVLLLSVSSIAGAYVFDARIKEALARAAGMFDARAPWADARLSASANPFVHPLAGYTLRTPRAWEHTPGPMHGTSEFVVRQESRLGAILRPSCEVSEEPLAVTVRKLEEQWPALRRACSHFGGLDACLLRRPLPAGNGELWDWIAHVPDTARSIRLQFLIYERSAEHDAYAIIGSAEPAPSAFRGLPCPTPLEWATPF